jgi:hypothetical protein
MPSPDQGITRAANVAGIFRSMGRRSQFDDTSTEAQSVQQALYASMTPAEKLTRMSELTLAVNRLALAGLEARYPRESRHELLLRLARMRLGDDLVDRVYGARDGA